MAKSKKVAGIVNKVLGDKKRRMMLIVGAALFFLGIEVFFVAKKKVQENIHLVCVASYEYAKGYRGMIADENGDLYVLNAQNGVEKKVNGITVQEWELDFRNTLPYGIALTKKYIVVTFPNVDFFYRIEKKTGKVDKIKVEGFTNMAGVTTDGKSKIYIADGYKSKIIAISDEGKLLNVFGEAGGDENLTNPTQLTYDGGYIYALNTGVKRINKYSASGKFKDSWKDYWKANTVESIAADGKGRLYVNDHLGSKVWVFSTKGKLIGSCEKEASGRYEIIAPGGIAGGWDGYIYLCSHKIGKFEPL